MPQFGFKPTIPAIEWAKTIHALECAANVIGNTLPYMLNIFYRPL
jgi:hypothetical protein